MKINNRIAQIIKSLDLANNSFAENCGISSTSLQNILSGRSKPGFDLLESILSKYPQVDANWLIKGKEGAEPIEKIMSRNEALIQIENLISELKEE